MDDHLISALNKLLREIESFDKSHPKQGLNQFNIFNAMRSSNDEVRLHSRFIASLLDPMAPHGMGREPLRLFIKRVGLPDTIANDDNLSVRPNYLDKSEYEEMDILIRSDKYAVLIENKVFAQDSNFEKDEPDKNGNIIRKGQIERYYESLISKKDDKQGYGPYIRGKNVDVLYLTVDRHAPSDVSIGNDRTHNRYEELENVRCIDYCHEILDWLSDLLEIKDLSSDIKGYISQYKAIIIEMTQKMEIKERQEIVEAIGNMSEDDRKAISKLFANERDICWHIMDKFIISILANSEGFDVSIGDKKYPEEEIYKVIASNITNIIHHSSGEYSFDITIKKNEKICIVKFSRNNSFVLVGETFKPFGAIPGKDFCQIGNSDFIALANTENCNIIAKQIIGNVKNSLCCQ